MVRTTLTGGQAPRRRTRKNGEAVGIKLVVETMKHAPVDLSSAERLLLIVLAEQANEHTRECWPGRELIEQHTGMTRDAVRKTLQRLAARGLEVRVPVGQDRKGRNVYAFEGQRTTYRIPFFGPGSPPEWGDDIPTTVEGQESPHSEQVVGTSSLSGGTPVPQRRDSVPTHPLKTPQDPSSPRAPRDCIRKFVQLTEEEERECELWINKEHAPRGPGWWRSLAENGDLEMIIRAWKAQRTPTAPRKLPDLPPKQDTMPEATPEFHAARDAARTARHAPPSTTSRPSLETAQAVLDGLDYAAAAEWKRRARAQLPGAQQADDAAVTILAAQLADQTAPFRNALAKLRNELPGLEDPAVLDAAIAAAQELLDKAPDADRRRVKAIAARAFAEKGINDRSRELIHAAEIRADLIDFPKGRAA